jgi:hypothetical protein
VRWREDGVAARILPDDGHLIRLRSREISPPKKSEVRIYVAIRATTRDLWRPRQPRRRRRGGGGAAEYCRVSASPAPGMPDQARSSSAAGTPNPPSPLLGGCKAHPQRPEGVPDSLIGERQSSSRPRHAGRRFTRARQSDAPVRRRRGRPPCLWRVAPAISSPRSSMTCTRSHTNEVATVYVIAASTMAMSCSVVPPLTPTPAIT